ncbi:MAG TPA: hypothetical protein VD927_05785 [Chryseosolibacter sp.]|nr:hypothetical protein [Chryseosolibacter sp.]
MKIDLLFVLLLTLHAASATAQTNHVSHIQNGTQNIVEFRDKQNKLLKTLDLTTSSPYMKATTKWERTWGSSRFKISAKEVPELVNGFFDRSNFPKESTSKLNPEVITTASDVVISNHHVIIADQLMLYGVEGGLIGVRSQVKVYNRDGNLIGSLPENNEGYYEPVVTSDGEYLAANFGALTAHVDYTLVPHVGFRVYDLKTNKIIFELGKADSSYDVLSPAVHNDMIIQVLDLNNDQYEYFVILPMQKKIYRKVFSREEVGNFVRIESDKFILRGSGNVEVPIEFEKSFTKDVL